MLTESIFRSTLGIKPHVVKSVQQHEEGLDIALELRKRRRLPCGVSAPLGVCLIALHLAR